LSPPIGDIAQIPAHAASCIIEASISSRFVVSDNAKGAFAVAREVINPENIPSPPFIRTLFSTTKFAWLWTIIRVYVGWQWLSSGWNKVGNPAWTQTGAAVRGFWANAVAIPETGNPPIRYGWYRSFLNFLLEGEHHTWMAKLIVAGEILVGIGLIFGALVGFAAFFGALMNFNFMLAGTASTNPVLFLLSILIMAAWKVAGYYGVDRWLLPMVGTPWQRDLTAATSREARA